MLPHFTVCLIEFNLNLCFKDDVNTMLLYHCYVIRNGRYLKSKVEWPCVTFVDSVKCCSTEWNGDLTWLFLPACLFLTVITQKNNYHSILASVNSWKSNCLHHNNDVISDAEFTGMLQGSCRLHTATQIWFWDATNVCML